MQPSFPINGLDFNEIKANFIEFLKQDPTYRDYNFEASGINSLINIFAYNAHYIGYYVKMLLNESFIDSAVRRETLLSKAKLNGYIPRGMRSARAKVILKCSANIDQEPDSKSVIIPRGSYFSGANAENDSRTFYVIDDVICTEREEYISNGNHKVRYTSPEFTVYEGTLKKWRFKVDANDPNQRFVIKDESIDIDTLRISVFDNENSTEKKEFSLASNLFKIDALSEVFYLSTNEEGYYEIFFGNDQFGRKLSSGNVIEAVYLSTKGESGNGCKSMVFVKPQRIDSIRNTVILFTEFSTIVTEVSNGGMQGETIDEMRFNIPHHYRRQNRIVTESDYKSVLLSEFRNIDSISVWGGEKNFIKDYGTVFVCVKPKKGLKLSGSAREDIEKILGKYGTVGTKFKIVDPEYLIVDVDIFVKFSQSRTSKTIGELQKYVFDKAMQYSIEKLDRFDAGLSEVDFLDYIREGEPSITRIYSAKKMTKILEFTYRTSSEYIVFFGNKVKPGSLVSSEFDFGRQKCKIVDDMQGGLWIVDNNNIKAINRSIGTIEYGKGLLRVILDLDITSGDSADTTHGTMKFTAVPEIPDIETYLNNIIIFNNVTVTVGYA
jgi:hypothetical protein